MIRIRWVVMMLSVSLLMCLLIGTMSVSVEVESDTSTNDAGTNDAGTSDMSTSDCITLCNDIFVRADNRLACHKQCHERFD